MGVDLSEVKTIVCLLDRGHDTETIRERLVEFGEQALPTMLECLPNLRTWKARQAVVYTAMKFSRRSNIAKRIGFIGLEDKSKRVRHIACTLAAFSLDTDFLPSLKALLKATDVETAQDAKAAIRAIQNQNHHLFRQRPGEAPVFWYVLGSDTEPS